MAKYLPETLSQLFVMTTQATNRDILVLSSLSDKKPSLMYIHGFFTGIASHPDVVPFGQWFETLFGDIHFQAESQQKLIDSLMVMHNKLMLEITNENFRLPAKCKLSKSDYQASLRKGEPLPEWCAGMLASLKFIDRRTLTKSQKEALNDCIELITGFSGIKQAENTFTSPYQSLEKSLHEAKRYLSTMIHNTIYELRFFNPNSTSFMGDMPGMMDEMPGVIDDDYDNLTGSDFDEQMETFEEDFDFAMFEDSQEAAQVRDEMILSFECMMGKAWFKQNQGHFWGLHETRPYMMLRARRAEINAINGQFDSAIEELRELMLLNPMDNQGNRYLLASCLAIRHLWQELKALLVEMERMGEYSTFYWANKALMLFALEGGSSAANEAKKELHVTNKHLTSFLTGQKKTPDIPPEMYSPGSKEEVFIYIFCRGKEAWRAVDGALFWLRRK